MATRNFYIVSHVKGRRGDGEPPGDSLGFVCADATRLERGKCYDWPCSPGLTYGHAKEVKTRVFTNGKDWCARDFLTGKESMWTMYDYTSRVT